MSNSKVQMSNQIQSPNKMPKQDGHDEDAFTNLIPNNFEPRIIGFYCNWSSQIGVDSAGIEGASYPPNLRLIRVMCSGSVDPEVVIEAFKRGADGVLILGCHLGNCHYRNGNYNALRRYRLLQKMLEQFGLERERLRLEWVSVAEGKRFAGLVGEMTEELRRLGPLRQLA